MTTTASEARKMLRKTNHCLYASIPGNDYNVKVAGIITQHGTPTVATTGGVFYGIEKVTAWIDGRNGRTL